MFLLVLFDCNWTLGENNGYYYYAYTSKYKSRIEGNR